MIARLDYELLGIKKAGGSLQALMTRLEELHLIERFRPWTADGTDTGGKFPDLVRLTEYGAYHATLIADPALLGCWASGSRGRKWFTFLCSKVSCWKEVVVSLLKERKIHLSGD